MVKFAACLILVVVLTSVVDCKRRGGSSSSRRGSPFGNKRTTTHAPRAPPPYHKEDSSGNNHFLNAERGSSTGTTHNRGDVFSQSNPQRPPNTNGPIGFEGIGGRPNQNNNHQIGFDRVNSEVQNKPGSSHYPSAPPPYNPQHPPAHPNTQYGGNDLGRPANAPPPYQPWNTHTGQTNTNQPGFGNNYQGSGQYNPYQGNGFGNNYNQNHQFGNQGHGFGNPSYPGNSFGGGGSPFGNSYQGNSFGGSPFGGGYNGNPYYSPNNFGYSNYPGQYNNYQQKSRFGGLPIPIPIPIPIPLGGGFGGLFGDHSNKHRLIDTFINSNNTTEKGNSSTSVFILNNSTVAPCTTDHWVYDLLKVTVLACTAEHCTAIKVTTTTTNTSRPSVHSASFTMCLENKVSVSHHGHGIDPTLSEVQKENMTVCHNVTVKSTNVTENLLNETSNSGNNKTDATTESITTTEMSTTSDSTNITEMATTPNNSSGSSNNSTKVCEDAECSRVEMCLPFIEIVDQCNSLDCPLKRTGYKPCVTLKMCRSPSTPLSSYASINTTISKIDEFSHHNSVYDAANLTLITYHRPVVTFNSPTSS